MFGCALWVVLFHGNEESARMFVYSDFVVRVGADVGVDSGYWITWSFF